MQSSAKIIIIGLAAALAIVSGIAAVYASYTFQGGETEKHGIITITDAGENQTITEQGFDAPPQFLFVQHAASGTIQQENDSSTAAIYKLTLNDISQQTVRFADRPYRFSDTMPVGAFVAKWSEGQDSFAADPPNAALIIDGNTVIVELLNPVYDSEKNSLTYDIASVNPDSDDGRLQFATKGANSSNTFPSSFGQASLFIDDAGDYDW